MLRSRNSTFLDPTLHFARPGRAGNEWKSAREEVRNEIAGVVITPASTCAMKYISFGGSTSESVTPLLYLSAGTPATFASSSTCIPKVAAVRCRGCASAVIILRLRGSMTGCGQPSDLFKRLTHRSRGLERTVTLHFSPSLFSHPVFSILTACLVAMSDWVSFSALSRNYRLD